MSSNNSYSTHLVVAVSHPIIQIFVLCVTCSKVSNHHEIKNGLMFDHFKHSSNLVIEFITFILNLIHAHGHILAS